MAVSYTHLDVYKRQVGFSVLASIVPIKEDDVARTRFIAVVLPQPAFLEPGNTLGCAGCKLRDNPSFNIAALHGDDLTGQIQAKDVYKRQGVITAWFYRTRTGQVWHTSFPIPFGR